MKVKNRKLTKLLTVLGCSSLVMAGASSFAAAASVIMGNNNISQNQVNEATSSTRAASTSYDLRDNLVIDVSNLNSAFANYYFSELDFNNTSDKKLSKYILLIKQCFNTRFFQIYQKVR